MIKDSEATDRIVPLLIELANDEARQTVMKTNLGKLAVRDADTIIATEILKLIN